ncbi:hypothetical protein V8G54_006546 [Vigna mungo]|uniref:Apple domain-containing protein n=1 Tax=Vigna mungo TaxID=3915 RepID=A0AAQ3S4N2_VIGMU
MARGKWVFSYKKTTLLVCFFNIVVALYVLRSLYASLYIYSGNVSRNVALYNPDQIRKMEESMQIRREFKPVELIKWVKALEGELSSETAAVELPQHLKQNIIDEILQRLRGLNSSGADIAKEREVVENWRKGKLEEVKSALVKGTSNSTIPHEEAGMNIDFPLCGILARALESDWALLCEEIGLWVPAQVANEEHDDKPEGAEEPLSPECHAELHTDYDGSAVRWGLTHHKDSAADCCQACLDHAKHAKEGEKKCNIWVYCPSEFGCHSPDIYQHKHQECWLKYVSSPPF